MQKRIISQVACKLARKRGALHEIFENKEISPNVKLTNTRFAENVTVQLLL